MCGRFAHKYKLRELYELLARGLPTVAWHETGAPLARPSYNVAPTQMAPIARLAADGSGGEVVSAKWGLIPVWAKDAKIGNQAINARADTVAEKPMFRAAYKRRRCIVPVSGFYEWQAIEGEKVKQPWFITMADGGIMPMAGLWERWDKGDEPVESFTILTTDANAMMAKLHHRMPVILDPADFGRWLNAETNPDAADLLKPYPADEMDAYKVSRTVNSPKNNVPECLERAG